MSMSVALMTDKYELTMLDAALAHGSAHRTCVFEVFTRRLPSWRRYGVVAGTGRFLEALNHFHFTKAHIDMLHADGALSDTTLDYLANYRFTGTISGYAEGEIYFPHSPSSPSKAPSQKPSSWKRWSCQFSTTTQQSHRQHHE